MPSKHSEMHWHLLSFTHTHTHTRRVNVDENSVILQPEGQWADRNVAATTWELISLHVAASVLQNASRPFGSATGTSALPIGTWGLFVQNYPVNLISRQIVSALLTEVPPKKNGCTVEYSIYLKMVLSIIKRHVFLNLLRVSNVTSCYVFNLHLFVFITFLECLCATCTFSCATHLSVFLIIKKTCWNP